MRHDRHARVVAVLDELSADVAVITSPANRAYLTGFTGDLSASTTRDAALVTRTGVTLLAYPIHAGWAGAEIDDGVEIVANRDWLESATELVKAAGWTTVAIDDVTMPHAAATALCASLPDGVTLVPIGTKLAALRSQKEPDEIEAIRRASLITDRVFADASEWVVAGTTERALATKIKETFYRLGADDLAFDVIVASGPNAAKPHHRPSDRALVDGDAVVLDLGCRLDRYCSDLTRTLPVGQPTERFATLYNATLAARAAAVALIEPGRPAKEIARASIDAVTSLGLEELLMHGLGHGVGLQVHEAPAISERSDDVLAVGHVFSVEPGVYDPVWGGVRTEDVVAVTEGGCETITTAPTLDLGGHG